MKTKLFLLLVLIFSAVALAGCTANMASMVGMSEKCVVIARRAQIRSSGAVVAADLLEVSRGQTLEVLGEEMFENEKWLNVRASDEEHTEGWIEARNVLRQNVLEESQKLADEDKDIPSQAAGQLRAASNLRLRPDRSDENILLKLEGGATFDIVGWKRIPKTEETGDKDDAPKANVNQNLTPRQRRRLEREANAPPQMDDKYETWYKVRLHPSVSPAPAGWVYGKQVELAVPSDIIFYRTGREFVAWRRLDDDSEPASSFMSRVGKEANKETKPGSWVILEKSNTLQEPEGEEPDFDRILILGYDKFDQQHYKVYRSGNIKGFLPLRVVGSGDSRAFTVTLKMPDGQKKDIQFGTFKDARGHLKVNIPPDIPKDSKSGD